MVMHGNKWLWWLAIGQFHRVDTVIKHQLQTGLLVPLEEILPLLAHHYRPKLYIKSMNWPYNSIYLGWTDTTTVYLDLRLTSSITLKIKSTFAFGDSYLVKLLDRSTKLIIDCTTFSISSLVMWPSLSEFGHIIGPLIGSTSQMSFLNWVKIFIKV